MSSYSFSGLWLARILSLTALLLSDEDRRRTFLPSALRAYNGISSPEQSVVTFIVVSSSWVDVTEFSKFFLLMFANALRELRKLDKTFYFGTTYSVFVKLEIVSPVSSLLLNITIPFLLMRGLMVQLLSLHASPIVLELSRNIVSNSIVSEAWADFYFNWW